MIQQYSANALAAPICVDKKHFYIVATGGDEACNSNSVLANPDFEFRHGQVTFLDEAPQALDVVLTQEIMSGTYRPLPQCT